MKNKKIKAFSLNELLVVMVIIGILAAIAVPKFNEMTAGAYSAETGVWLNAIELKQGVYHKRNFKYSMSFEDIKFTPPKQKPEGTSVYNYEMVEATNTTFICKATAVNDYDGDGIKEEITIDQEGVIRTTVED